MPKYCPASPRGREDTQRIGQIVRLFGWAIAVRCPYGASLWSNGLASH
jgi:hypothetical protein